MIERLILDFQKMAGTLLGLEPSEVKIDSSLSSLAKGDDHSPIYQLPIEIEATYPAVRIDLSDEPLWPSIQRLAEITADQMRVSA